ncbi:hypothetical protein BV25DRAFT_1816871, partial [Artomyces pyxidatus]
LSSSTHNQRIERFWVDVGAQFCRRWRAFFSRLERLHGLVRESDHHLWLLQMLFLPLINTDCMVFREEWNSHPISTEGNRTPSGIRLACTVEHGVYPSPDADECADVHPNLLNRYYGIDRSQPANSPADSADSDASSGHSDDPGTAIAQRIADDQQHHIRHDPIEVADHRNPFPSHELEAAFWTELNRIDQGRILPASMMLTQAEWDEEDGEDGYPASEEIQVGRAHRLYEISLPHEVWFPRAVRWCQAITLLNEILVALE